MVLPFLHLVAEANASFSLVQRASIHGTDLVHAVQPNTFHISLILLCSLEAKIVTKLDYSRGEKEVLSVNSKE